MLQQHMPGIFLGNPGNRSCQQTEQEITQHVGVGTDTLETFLCPRVSVTAVDKSSLRESEASRLTGPSPVTRRSWTDSSLLWELAT